MIYRRLAASKLPFVNRYMFGVDANKLTIGVPKEVFENEKRVSVTPDTVQRVLKKNGCTFLVEENAGLEAAITNEAYVNSGAKIVSKEEALNADVILKVRMPIDE